MDKGDKPSSPEPASNEASKNIIEKVAYLIGLVSDEKTKNDFIHLEKSLKQNGFKVIIEDNPIKFDDYIKKILAEVKENSILFIYIITSLDSVKAVNPLDCWEHFKGINKVYKIINIQDNQKKEDQTLKHIPLMNLKPEENMSRDKDKYRPNVPIPSSANIVISYLPNIDTSTESPAETLSGEMNKSHTINTLYTNVIKILGHNARFNSSFREPLSLGHRFKEPVTECYNITDCKKCVVRSFLIGNFGNIYEDLTTICDIDHENLEDMCKKMNFSYKRLEDSVLPEKEFQEKYEAVFKEEEMKSCECIIIVISSHGTKNNLIYTSDKKEITLDYLLHVISSCDELKSKPKILLLNACRGGETEQNMPKSPKPNQITEMGVNTSKNVSDTEECVNAIPSKNVSDTLIVFSSTKGMKTFADENKLGSLCINVLCKKLVKNRNEDILDIINISGVDVANLFGSNDKNETQQLTFTSLLSKRLRFPN